MKTRIDRPSLPAIVSTASNPPLTEATPSPQPPLGPSQTLAATPKHAAQVQARSPSLAQRTLGMLNLGRLFRPAVAAALLGAALIGTPAQAQTAPVETQTCVTEMAAAVHAQTQVQDLRRQLDEVVRRLEGAGHGPQAEHLKACIQRFAPDGVHDAPLVTLLAALQGDEAAQANLPAHLEQHGIQVTQSPDKSTWDLQAYLRTGNDNMATLFDGQYRSDDGATASLGAGMVFTRGDQRVDVDVDYQMLTERGGMQRTDLVTALVSHTKTKDAGGFRLSYGYDLGLVGTGDFGGAQVQDGWHGLNEGTLLGGRRLGRGLQNVYSTDPQVSLLTGVHAGALKDLGLVDLYGGLEARAPIGPTGQGWVGGNLGVDIGSDKGLYADLGVTARYQWTQGDALSFDGAPVDDQAVFIPHIGVGWQGDNWRVGVDWYRNDLGTKPGIGDLNSDNVMLTLTIGGGRRSH